MHPKRERHGVFGSLNAPISSVIWSYLCRWRTPRNQKGRKAEKIKRKEEQNAMPPKVIDRERALSVSGYPGQTKAQLQSRLCVLPAELRFQIYEELLGKRQGIHVVLVKGLLHAYRCQWAPDLNHPSMHQHCWRRYRYGSRDSSASLGSAESTIEISQLLLSCRAM
jgi:hypothetical protein